MFVRLDRCLFAARPEALGSAGGFSEFVFHDCACQKRMLQQLGDLVALADGIRFVAEVLPPEAVKAIAETLSPRRLVQKITIVSFR